MIKEKYLYFMDESDGLFNTAFDSLCVPLSRLKGFRANGTTTQLEIELKPLVGYADSDDDTFVADHVTLTITAARNIDKPMIAICDTANSVFASSHISGCATNVTAEA
jgi:hypothetical protein